MMLALKALIFSVALTCIYGQGPNTTPVPILKQVNRQNDDGSYSFGYEAADGSFKIETKYPTGEVAGKYGYVDESGKLREISYGASSQRGFEPQGTGIMVPPPTLNDPNTNPLPDGQEDDGQYREDPKIYEDPKYNGRAQSRPSSFRSLPQPQYQQTYQSEPTYQRQTQQYQPQTQQYQPQPSYQPQPQKPQLFTQSFFNQAPQAFPQENRPQSQVFHQQPQFSYQGYTAQPQQYQQSYQQSYQPQNYQNQNYNPFSGHPATNFDPNTGSYTINFTGK